jgi:hypothetical protein
MRELGLSSARRGRPFKVTTRSDERQNRPADLVDRQFKATGLTLSAAAGATVAELMHRAEQAQRARDVESLAHCRRRVIKGMEKAELGLAMASPPGFWKFRTGTF